MFHVNNQRIPHNFAIDTFIIGNPEWYTRWGEHFLECERMYNLWTRAFNYLSKWRTLLTTPLRHSTLSTSRSIILHNQLEQGESLTTTPICHPLYSRMGLGKCHGRYKKPKITVKLVSVEIFGHRRSRS